MVGEIVLAILWAVSGWIFNRVYTRQRDHIARLDRENLSCAKAIIEARKEAKEAKSDAAKSLEVVQRLENRLTSTPAKPKIEAKPKRLTWRGTLAAIERENEKESAEA